MSRTIIAIVGIALGLYLIVWEGIVKGPVVFVEALKASPVDSWGIAWGVCRFLVLPSVGAFVIWLAFVSAVLFGKGK